MADLTDAANGLVQTIAAIVYPNGTSAPSVTGVPVKVFQGWPDATQLTTDLAAGTVDISVVESGKAKSTSVTQDGADYEEISNNGITGFSSQEIGRWTQGFRVSIWANCFTSRDALAPLIISVLAQTSRIIAADGSTVQVSFQGSQNFDDQQKAGIYRRDITCALNYGIYQVVPEFTILKNTINVSGGSFAQAGPTLSLNP